MEPTRLVILGDGPDNVFIGHWPDRILDTVNRPELHIYDVENPRGFVMICSGGGYLRLMHDREGVELALWLNSLGYTAGVLVHRLPGATHSGGVWPKDIALRDALAGLAHVDRISPLFIMGLSSGGHLAGVIACQQQTKAAGVLIAYAPINANHADYKSPVGKADYPPAEKQAFYNDWPIGIAAQPHGLPKCPVFLAYALHDKAVPVEHALNIIAAARDTGMDLDAHIFGQAPHGFAVRDKDGTHDAWPGLAAAWMARKSAPEGAA